MTWKSKLITEQERDLYTDFVSHHEKSNILQSYEWGEVKATGEWCPIRMMIYKDDTPKGAISILKRSIPGGKTIFYATRGPVIDPTDTEACDFLFSEIKNLAKKEKAIYLKIDPDVLHDNVNWQNLLTRYKFKAVESKSDNDFGGFQPQYVFKLDITPDEETLLMNLHQKTRYNLRLAKKKGVTVKISDDKADLPIFYDILKITAKRDQFGIRGYDYFEAMFDKLVAKGLGKLFIAYYEDTPISGALLLTYGKTALYLYGASSNEYRNKMPNYLMQWEMIMWSKQNGYEIYDFRGVHKPSPEKPEDGLYRFKKGFNATFCEYIGEYDLIYNPTFYRLYNQGLALFRKAVAAKRKMKGGK